jgi:hypothetical protein
LPLLVVRVLEAVPELEVLLLLAVEPLVERGAGEPVLARVPDPARLFGEVASVAAGWTVCLLAVLADGLAAGLIVDAAAALDAGFVAAGLGAVLGAGAFRTAPPVAELAAEEAFGAAPLSLLPFTPASI